MIPFNKYLLREIQTWQDFFGRSPHYTDVDWLYTMFAEVKDSYRYDSQDSNWKWTDIRKIQFVLGIILFVLIQFNLFNILTIILILFLCDFSLPSTLFWSLNLNTWLLIWIYYIYKNRLDRRIFAYLKYRKILNKNRELLLLDNDIDLESNNSQPNVKNVKLFKIKYWFVNKIIPLIMLISILTLYPIVPLLFGLCLIWMVKICVLLIEIPLTLMSMVIPTPQMILNQHSCIKDKTYLDLKLYLAMVRNLWFDRNRKDLKRYLSKSLRLPEDKNANNQQDRDLYNYRSWYNDYLWELHFKEDVLREILIINDKYYDHFFEANESVKQYGDDKVLSNSKREASIHEDDILLSSSEILEHLGLELCTEDLNLLKNDSESIRIFLDLLETNWRNYHRWWNRKFFQLCKDLRLKDLDPRIWEYYGSKDSLGNPFGFKPTYPTEENKIQFCIETMVIFQTKGWNLMKDKI